jgi:hypothetical protein
MNKLFNIIVKIIYYDSLLDDYDKQEVIKQTYINSQIW